VTATTPPGATPPAAAIGAAGASGWSHRLTARALWVTWEHQRRNHGIATALGVPLLEIDLKAGRLRRYAVSAWRTVRALVRSHPAVIFVQNPSLVLALLGVAWGRFTGTAVVVDAHNAATIPLASPRQGLLFTLSRFIVRHATFTIVTNQRVAEVIEANGGRAIVLPDRVPTFEWQPRPDRDRRSILFICTFAPDEPFMAVLDAAARLDPAVLVFITGNPKQHAEAVRAAAPANVVLTGFLPESDYIDRLHAVDVVMDLTTRDDCLVCGAYEAVAALQPMILSDNQATRDHFNSGVVYTDNSVADLARAMTEALARRDPLRQQVTALKARLENDWRYQLERLITAINTRKAGDQA